MESGLCGCFVSPGVIFFFLSVATFSLQLNLHWRRTISNPKPPLPLKKEISDLFSRALSSLPSSIRCDVTTLFGDVSGTKTRNGFNESPRLEAEITRPRN